MKSGLWILGVVLIVAILVGVYFNRKNREVRDWAEIEAAEDPQAKIGGLEAFISDYPESDYRPKAYEMLVDLMLEEVGDTAGFLALADDLLKIEEDTECRDMILAGLDSARNTRARLSEIQDIEDPEVRIAALEGFIAEFPESKNKGRAYYMIGSTMVRSLQDTAGLEEFADRIIREESDTESKAAMYYLLYRTHVEPNPDKALSTATRLAENPIGADWVYSYIGYDLGDRDMDLDLALALCDKALELSKTGEDSAGSFDSRGWIYLKKGAYEKALRDFEMAVALLEEPYEEFLAHLAQAALKAGESDKAFDTFESIVVMGEYDYARTSLDSLMDVRGYSQEQKEEFERSIWESRIADAEPAESFNLPTLAGAFYRYGPTAGRVSLLNFTSPT